MKKVTLNQRIKKLLQIPTTPIEKFHELTKIKRWSPEPPQTKWPKSWTTVFFKEYPRFDKIFLPEPNLSKKITLESALFDRRSKREFSEEKLSLEKISNLLYYSAGIRYPTPNNIGNRFYPSPGGRYTLEVYVIALNSELPRGIYHYNIRNHSLEVLKEFSEFKKNFYINQDWAYQAGCLILVTSIFERNIIKYQTRGYRHIMQEAGHLGQNFYLVASALKLSICAIGGYVDDRLNKLLDINGAHETVIYPLAVGNSKVLK